MGFNFKDLMDHIEQSLVDSIKELKKTKKPISSQTAVYLFGLSLSSFFEDKVSNINIKDKNTQNELLEAFRLGWKDGIAGEEMKNPPAGNTPPAPPAEQAPPANQGGGTIQPPGGAPAGPDQLGPLPMPNTPPAAGGIPPNPNNPEEQPPEELDKQQPKIEKLDFRQIKQRFLREGKFDGVPLKI